MGKNESGKKKKTFLYLIKKITRDLIEMERKWEERN